MGYVKPPVPWEEGLLIQSLSMKTAKKRPTFISYSLDNMLTAKRDRKIYALIKQ